MYQRSVSLPKPLPAAAATEEATTSAGAELSKRNLRWRLLLMLLRSSRAFSEARKIIVDNQDAFFNTFSRSISYTAIDVQPQPQCFSAVDKPRLSKLVREKSTHHLNHFGGIQGLVSRLETSFDKGIDSDDQSISLRRQNFGSNTFQVASPKILRVVLGDPILVLLFLSTSLSLGFRVRREGLRGVSDGLWIYLSICLVMAAIYFSNIWPTTQFQELSKSKNCISTFVIRDGVKHRISANEAVVGDLVCLQTGDQVPADGLFIDGNSFQVNESGLTREAAEAVEITNGGGNPFLLAGSKVTNGDGRMLVTAVGMDTRWGEIMSSTCPTEDKTPLQVKLHKLTRNTAKIGLYVASAVFVILVIKYFTGKMKDSGGEAAYNASKSVHDVFMAIIGILVMPIVIAAAAIPEGLLLAATITLAYSTKRMAAEKAVVRNLAACEAIGSIEVICIDRCAAVSSKSPQVDQFWLGQVKFKRKPSQIAGAILELLHEGIGLNITNESSSVLDELQVQSEKAICSWASKELGMNLEQLKGDCSMLDVGRLNLQKKEGCIGIRKNNDDKVHIHMKGSMDEILPLCSHYYEEDGVIKGISETVREEFKENVEKMKNDGLKCIAYAHASASGDLDDNELNEEHDFTLIGCLCLKDLFRHNVSKVVAECQEAGVCVKMITAEDVQKAKLSAPGCGILDPNIIEGREFRNLNDEEMLEKTKRCNVIAGACSSDKLLLVQCLKQNGHTVGFIGGCPGDEKLFEEADVGFYLGIDQECPSMMEKSDVIISGDSFDPIAKAMKWGRGINNNIQIYAQFQLTATMTSLVTDSVTAIFAGEPPTINIVTAISSGKIPFAALQILWVKLIVGILVVLALSVDNPADRLMKKMPVDQQEPFITNIMWRDIIGQALCQITILLTIQFEGESSFKLNAREKDTLIFNITVLCQIFTVFNTVKGKKVFKRLKNKRLFWIVIGIIVFLQVVIVEFLKKFAGTERLNRKQWRACIGIAMISWVIGWLLRRIPVPRKPYFCFLFSHRSHQ